MKHSKKLDRPSKFKYNKDRLSKETRNVLARIFVQLRSEGWTPKKISTFLENAGCPIPRTTLRTWELKIESGRDALISEPRPGACRCLEDWQIRLVVGYVLHQNEQLQKVNAEKVQKFIHVRFGMKLSRGTVGKYLKESGFSSRVMKTKTSGFKKTSTQLAEEVVDFIKTQRKAKTMEGLKTSIDFTFTSHRTTRHFSYARVGENQPVWNGKLSRYTNCIVTCEWSDGVNRTPAMVFTKNPEFRTDRKITDRRFQLEQHLEACLAETAARVKYVGKLVGEKRTYVSESAKLVRLFF